MGRYISCGIATQINIHSKVNVKENKEDILNRVKCAFDLKYYDVVENEEDNDINLYLKEDVFNKEFKDLLKELTEIRLFWEHIYDNFKEIESEYGDSERKKKEKVIDYLDNNFNLYITKEKKIENKGKAYTYYLGEGKIDSLISYENYFYCTDMCENTLFNDDLSEYNVIKVCPYFIPLYLDFVETDSEDICFTLRLLNHFLKTSLKSNLRYTLIFGLTE